MREPMLEIPYGVGDFTAIREQNMAYVDKTHFIAELEAAGRFIFFLRPRRSGKSLMLTTLSVYYDCNSADRFEKLFGGSWIGSNPTPEKNQYMVLIFNFSKVRPEPDLVEASFEQYIQTTLTGFFARYRGFFEASAITAMEKMTTAGDRLNALFESCQTRGLKLYILIDEYDNFTNTILTTHGKTQYQHLTHGAGFFRYFFNVLKGGTSGQDSGLSRLFITGVSPVTMDDVTSGFNIGTQVSMEPQFQAIAGFTKEEAASALRTFNVPDLLGMHLEEVLSTLETWYGGYRYSPDIVRPVFNPDMVLYFIRAVTRLKRMPDEMVDQNVRTDYGKLHYLLQVQKRLNGNFNLLKSVIEAGSVTSRIAVGFPVEEVAKTKNFVSLLYYLGLLTISGNSKERGRHELVIPNQTVALMMYGYLRDAWEANNVFQLSIMKLDDQLHAMAFKGNWKPFFQSLAEAVATQTAIRDFMDGEKVLQGFLLAYLCAFDYFIAYSEQELNKGFCDLMLAPFKAGYPDIRYGYLIELKYIKRSETLTDDLIQAKVAEARTQLNQYRKDRRLGEVGDQIEWIQPVLVFHGWELVYYDT